MRSFGQAYSVGPDFATLQNARLLISVEGTCVNPLPAMEHCIEKMRRFFLLEHLNINNVSCEIGCCLRTSVLIVLCGCVVVVFVVAVVISTFVTCY